MHAHSGPRPWAAAVITALAILQSGPSTAGAEESPPRESSAEASQDRVAQLVQQLGDRDYFVRQRAQSELMNLGFEAFEALAAAEDHEDLEIATRAKYLLRLLRVNWTLADDPPEVKRQLEDYESLNEDQRKQRIRGLGALVGDKGIAALCRLVRFEKSAVLSKTAAVEILGRQPADEPPSEPMAELLKKNLGRSRRPATGWLLSYLRFRDDPREAVAAWSGLVDEEFDVLSRRPDETSPQVVAALVRVQINWLAGLGRKQDAVAAMWRLIDLEKGDPQTLAELLEWLVEQEAWDAIEKLAARFPGRFDDDPMLLYTLAQAQAEQGKKDPAEQTAAKARALQAGPQAEQIVTHLMNAFALQRRGLFDWAEKEFRHVLAISSAGHRLTITAYFGLSEMLHDQGRELAAAEALKPLVEWLDAMANAPDDIGGRTPGSIRSRMHHFYALHWAGQGDRKKQKEHLDAALAADPTDVDVLIACYRYPDATPEWKARIKRLLEAAAEEFRDLIAEDPEEAKYYNQYAWLVGNTEGDLDEALRFSLKSIELAPDAGGYYDTLGRVCYARGEIDHALRYQKKAVELDPHSGLLRRQLEIFEKAAENKQHEKPRPPSPKPDAKAKSDGG